MRRDRVCPCWGYRLPAKLHHGAENRAPPRIRRFCLGPVATFLRYCAHGIARLISAPGARRSYQSEVWMLIRSETCRGDPGENGDHAAQACRLISTRVLES